MTTIVVTFDHGEQHLPQALRQYVDLVIQVDPNDGWGETAHRA
jgi:hypothetical protein